MDIFNFITALILPVFLIIAGTIVLNSKVIKMNGLVGYRTARSMRCAHSWELSQKMMGEYFIYDGIILLIVSLLAMIIVYIISDSQKTRDLAPTALLLLQTLSLFAVIAKIESKLKTEHQNWDAK